MDFLKTCIRIPIEIVKFVVNFVIMVIGMFWIEFLITGAVILIIAIAQ